MNLKFSVNHSGKLWQNMAAHLRESGRREHWILGSRFLTFVWVAEIKLQACSANSIMC